MKYIVQMKGDDVVDIIHGVKDKTQSYVRNTGRFPSASFKTVKRQGTIEVENVDRDLLLEAFNKAVSSIPRKRVDYEIEDIEEVESKETTGHVSANEQFQHWVETAQKGWEKERRGYQIEIDKRSKQVTKLRDEKQGLKELLRQAEKRSSELEKAYKSVSKMVEGLVEEAVPDPSSACAQWVGDWSMTGFKLEADIEEACGERAPEDMKDLLGWSVEEILGEAANELGESIGTIGDLQNIADVSPWEETAKHRQLQADYQRAVEEMEFLEEVQSGRTKVPASMKDDMLAKIDKGQNKATIRVYEAEKSRYETHTEKAEMALSYVAKARDRQKLADVLEGLEEARSLPVAIVCREAEKWICETYYPSAESEGLIDSALEDVVRKAMRKHCSGVPEDEARENVKVCRGNVSGKHRSWKDVSRFQEKLHHDLVKGLQGSVLGSLGIPVSVSKIMNQRA